MNLIVYMKVYENNESKIRKVREGLFKVSTVAKTQELSRRVTALRDSLEQQKDLSMNEIDETISTIYFNTACYINYIDIKDGKIRAKSNFRDSNSDAKTGSGNPLPNSEILYNQLLLVLRHQQIDPSTFNLTQVIRENISNEETRNTLNCCTKTYSDVPSANKRIYQFVKGSEEYYAILGTPNAYGILYLLKQHPSVFGKKEITRIEVKKHRDYNKPNIILHVGERE